MQPNQSQSQSQIPEPIKEKSKSAPARSKTSIPDWYLDKMRLAFKSAGERLLGNHDITEEVFKRQVNLCCQDINLTFRSDAFTKIYQEEETVGNGSVAIVISPERSFQGVRGDLSQRVQRGMTSVIHQEDRALRKGMDRGIQLPLFRL